EPFLIALQRDRAELYRRVDARVDAMIEQGLIEEVEGFLAEGLTPDRISMQAHSYKEVMGYLLGRYDRDEAIRLLKRNTRRYVKYQLVWLRGEAGVHWVRADRSLDEVAEACAGIFRVGFALACYNRANTKDPDEEDRGKQDAADRNRR